MKDCLRSYQLHAVVWLAYLVPVLAVFLRPARTAPAPRPTATPEPAA